MTSVLIVDDDRELPLAMARDLRAHGMEVHVAQSVDEAMGVLGATHIDVLLTDLRMPDRDGIDLLQLVQAYSSATRSILMSGFATAKDSQVATDLGVVRVLCKPFSRAELLQAVREAVECQTGFRGSIHGLSLVDMLQMLHFARRSVTVTVGGAKRGNIHLDGGQIVAAECGDATGEPALRELLATPSGSLQTSVLQPTERNIHRDFQGLLLDALRQVDESTAGLDAALADAFDLGPASRPRASVPPASRPAPSPDRRASSIPARHERWSGVSAVVGYVAPDLIAAVYEDSPPRSTPLQDADDADELADSVRGIADALARVSPSWTGFECVGAEIGVAVVSHERGNARVLMAGVLAGRYASYRFRSQVGRVMARLSESDPRS